MKRSVYIPQEISNWFDETFVSSDSSIEKKQVYRLYCSFCVQKNLEPAKNNIFAKIVKRKFPHAKSRRLGPRGKGVPYFQGFELKKKITKHDLNEKMQWKAARGIMKLVQSY